MQWSSAILGESIALDCLAAVPSVSVRPTTIHFRDLSLGQDHTHLVELRDGQSFPAMIDRHGFRRTHAVIDLSPHPLTWEIRPVAQGTREQPSNGAQSDTTGTAPDAPSASETAQMKGMGLKLLIELSPLVLFFAVYARADIYVATGVLIAATLGSLVAAKALLGKISVMPIIMAGFVVVFGGLTLWFSNETFIKIKPTVVYICLASPLLIGLLFGKSFLSHVLGEAISLDESGWRKLSLRWGVFFLFLALLNEVVWRSFSTATWVSVKSFGFIPLTMIFAASQVPLMLRHKTQPQVGETERS